MLKNLHEAAGCPLGKQTEGPDAKGTATELAALSGLAPFTYGLEYSAPARGGWTIVHIGMLLPESHQVFVCAQSCLRGNLMIRTGFLPLPWMRSLCWTETARKSS